VTKSKKDLTYNLFSLNLINRPECELMILCLKQFLGYNSRNAIQSNIDQYSYDWAYFVEIISKQGVILPIAHVYKFFQINSIPTNTGKKLYQTQRYYVKRNQNLVKESIRIYNVLKENELVALPYKGIPLAKQFYGNIFQRISVDIDFALDIQHFEKAKEIMLSLGYEEFKSEVDHNAIEQSRAYYLDYPFVKRNENGDIVFNVEFHWTPSHQILNIPIKFSEFTDETEEIIFGEYKLKTFNRVHQALFAVIHHGNVDCWGKLKHLVDLTLIMNTLNDDELFKLEDLCKKYKIYNSLQTGKALLGAIFKDQRYIDLKVSKKWVNDIINGSLTGKWSDNKMKMYYFLKSRDSIKDTITATISILKYQVLIKPKLKGLE